MEIFSSIAEYLESRSLFKSAKMLNDLIKTISFDSTIASNEAVLLGKISAALPDKENKPAVSKKTEQVMEDLMSRLMINPSIVLSKTVDTGLDKLLQIKAFNKMISCADQMFFDNESMNISSKIINQSDQEASFDEESDMPSMSEISYSAVSSRSNLNE